MSVYYKLRTNDGAVSESEKNGGCWGFLKNDLNTVAREYQKQIDNLDEEYDNHASRQRIYGYTVESIDSYKKNRLLSMDKYYGIPIENLLTGISEVISCCHLIDDTEGGKLRYEALTTVMTAYPELFNCVTNIDRDEGEITVNFNDHYAVIYNVLRLIKKFKMHEMSRVSARAMIDNPALSLFILDFYANDYGRSVGESNVFTVHDTGIKAITNMVDRRDWYLSDRQRTAECNNASLRGGCSKSTRMSYVEIADGLTKRFTSYGLHPEDIIPMKLVDFLDGIPEELRGVA